MTHRKTSTTKTNIKEIDRIHQPKELKKTTEQLTRETFIPPPPPPPIIHKFPQSEFAQVIMLLVICILFTLILCGISTIEYTHYHNNQTNNTQILGEEQHSVSSRNMIPTAPHVEKDPLCSDPSFPLPREGNTDSNKREFSDAILSVVSQKFDHLKITKTILETETDQYYDYLYREYSPVVPGEDPEYDPLEILNDVKVFHSWCVRGISHYSPSDYAHVSHKTIHELKQYLLPSLDKEGLLAYSCSRGHITPFCINFVGEEKSLAGSDALVLSSGTNFGSTDLVNIYNSATDLDNKHSTSVRVRVRKMIQLGLLPGESISDSERISAIILRIEKHLFEISKYSLARNVDPNSLLFHSDVAADMVNHETMVLFMNLRKESHTLEFNKTRMRDWLGSSLGFSLDKYLGYYSEYHHQCDSIDLITASDGIEYFEHLFQILETIPDSHLRYYLIHCVFYSLYDSLAFIRKPINLSTMEYSMVVPWKASYRMEPPDYVTGIPEQFCYFVDWGYMSEHLSYLSCLISDVDKCYLSELHSSVSRVYDSSDATKSNAPIKFNSCATLLESYPTQSPNRAFTQLITELRFDILKNPNHNPWDLFSELLNRLLLSSASSPISIEYNYNGPTYDLLSGALIIPFSWSVSEGALSRDRSHHFETALYSSGLFECLKQFHRGTLKNYPSYTSDPEKLLMFSVLEGKRRLKNELDLSQSFCDIKPPESSGYSDLYEELSSVAFSLNHTLSLLKSTGIYKLNPRATLEDFFRLNAKHRTLSVATQFLENISTYSNYLNMSDQLTDRLISLNGSGYLWHLRRYKLNHGFPGQPLTHQWNHHKDTSIPVEIQILLEEALHGDDLALLDVFRKDRLISQCIFSPNPDFLKSLYCDPENW